MSKLTYPTWQVDVKNDYYFLFGISSHHVYSSLINKIGYCEPEWIFELGEMQLKNILLKSKIKRGINCTLFDEVNWWQTSNRYYADFIVTKNDLIADLNLE
jgi:hypothetical protein